ncbi:MAG: FAD:protein FMN transferase, partial [bacterium]
SDASEIGRVNLNAGQRAVQVSPDVVKIILQARKVSLETQGAFDISALPLQRLWNFKSSNPRVPTKEEIAEKRHLVDFRAVVLDSNTVFLPRPEMGLDLGAIAKGYAVDQAVAILKKDGYSDFMVEAGGDLRTVAGELTHGERKIWVRHPRKPDEFFAVIKKDQCAVATSGDYERFFEKDGQRFHHIIDPVTGYPARPVVSATIIAEEAVIADAYATAVFVLGPDRGLELIEKNPGLEGLIVFEKESESDSMLGWKVSKGIVEEIEIVN